MAEMTYVKYIQELGHNIYIDDNNCIEKDVIHLNEVFTL